MSNRAISEPASSSNPRMSPSRLRANTVLPAPMNVIFAIRRRLFLAAAVPLGEELGVFPIVFSDQSICGDRVEFGHHRLGEGGASDDVQAPCSQLQWNPS